MTPPDIASDISSRHATLLVQVSIQSLTAKSTSTVISNGLWGLDRIDQKSKKRDYMYHYSSVATGVHVYTVDTVHYSSQNRNYVTIVVQSFMLHAMNQSINQ